MQINVRRLKVLFRNILSWPFRLKNNIAFTAILQDSDFGKNILIGKNVKFYRSSLGDFSAIHEDAFVSDCSIGKYTSIAKGCYIGGAAHPVSWAGTALCFYCTRKQEEGKKSFFYKKYFDPFQRTTIGNDVWIGADAMIKAGVNIHDGAIIGMGAVITKDVGAYEIWAGNPARFIRKRFENEMCEALLETKWWEKDVSMIRAASQYIDQPQLFINKLKTMELN